MLTRRPTLLHHVLSSIAALAGFLNTAHGAPPDRVYPAPHDMQSADDQADAEKLPPLPEGVSEIRFQEIFKLPVGPGGLEYSDKAAALAGTRVRLLGYMVREDRPIRGRMLLAPFPFQLFTNEYGFAEDLPGNVVHVVMPEAERRQFVPHNRGLLLLTGVLELGNRDEPDGRISSVRLFLDPRTDAPALAKKSPPARLGLALIE